MENIKTLTEQHPNSVAQLFKAYGFGMEPTARNLNLLLQVYGNQALPVSNYTTVEVKGTNKPKLFDIINGGIDTLDRTLKVLNPKKAMALGTGKPDLESDRILGINKTLFLTLSGFVVLTFLIVLFKSK
ncbi:hypothetical protein [Pedobacter cryophilus]|uniref:Uncharacterized protein n=1 Tax=Pedobacter cryophilus TaxID=2571271 RepID=A0A4U1BYU8_9SPHI|nr:hypothetical protein [Pedobacter cryophilus]TKB96853.1 hypothetical protein FA046_12305 [Pedobacter cryophilus]